MIQAAASGFLSLCSRLLPAGSGKAQGQKAVGDKDCVYSTAREYVQLPLPSVSPPPRATAAGPDQSRWTVKTSVRTNPATALGVA